MQNDEPKKETKEEKFAFLSTRLKQLTLFLVVAAGGILFLPLWILNIFSSSKNKPRNYEAGNISLFKEQGFTAVFIAISIIILLMALMAWLSGWFKLYRQRKNL